MKTKSLLKIFVPIILIVGACAAILLTMGIPKEGPIFLGSTDISYPLIAYNNTVIVIDKENYVLHYKYYDLLDSIIKDIAYSPYGLSGNYKYISNPVLGDVDGSSDPRVIFTTLSTVGEPCFHVFLESYIHEITEDVLGPGEYWSYDFISDPVVVNIDGTKGIIFVAGEKIEEPQIGEDEDKFRVFGLKKIEPDSNYIGEQVFEPLPGYPFTLPGEIIDEITIASLEIKGIPVVSSLVEVQLPAGSKVKPVGIEEIDECQEGLVSFWKFENPFDLGYNNCLMNFLDNDNNMVTAASGKVGSAAEFNGSSFLEIDDNVQTGLDITDEMTIACWMKAGSINGYLPIISKWVLAGNQRSYELAINNGKIDFAVSSNGTDGHGGTVADSSISPDTWYHITATYDGSFLRVYINGSEITTGGWPVAYNLGIYNSTAAFNLGARPSNSFYFDGLIDELFIFDKALTQMEIAAIAGVAEEYTAVGPGIAFTIHTKDQSKLIRLSSYMDPVENVTKPGFLLGGPVIGYTPGYMGAPVAYDDSVVVLDKKVDADGKDKLNLRKITQNGENIDVVEVDIAPEPDEQEVVKCGEISIVENEDGTKFVVAPWHIQPAENLDEDPGFIICHFLDLMQALPASGGSVTYSWPFDTTYLKLTVAELTVDNITSNWLLFGTKALNVEQTEFLIPEIPEGQELLPDECGKGYAVADLDGDGYNEIVCVTNMGNLYISSPGIEPVVPQEEISGTIEIQNTSNYPIYNVDGELYAKQINVSLLLSSDDATHVCIKGIEEGQNEEDMPWSDPYLLNNGQTELIYPLILGEVKHIISAKFIKDDLESDPVTCQITLDTTKPQIQFYNIGSGFGSGTGSILCESDYVIKGTAIDENLKSISMPFYDYEAGQWVYNSPYVQSKSLDTSTGEFKIQLALPEILEEGNKHYTYVSVGDKATNYFYKFVRFKHKKPDLIVKKAYYSTSFFSSKINVFIDNALTDGSMKTYSKNSIKVKCVLYKNGWVKNKFVLFGKEYSWWGWGEKVYKTYYKTIEPGEPLPKKVIFPIYWYYGYWFTKFEVSVNVDGAIAESGFESINNNTGKVNKNDTYEYTPPQIR